MVAAGGRYGCHMAPASYLVVIGDRDAVAWLLTQQRMAFPDYRAREVSALLPGDELLIYTTRGCFHNPTRDRGRVIATAQATSAVERLDPHVVVAERTFGLGCQLAVMTLAPYPQGVELAPLVPDLDVFPRKSGWPTRIRRPLVRLPEQDAKLLRRRLKPHVAADLDRAVDSYLDKLPRTSAW